MTLAIWWRATRLFYSTVAPALLGISGLVVLLAQLPQLVENGHANLPLLLLLKLLTAPAVWYLAEQLRPHQYWLYFNLGLSRRWLWGSVLTLDGVLFMLVSLSISTLYKAAR